MGFVLQWWKQFHMFCICFFLLTLLALSHIYVTTRTAFPLWLIMTFNRVVTHMQSITWWLRFMKRMGPKAWVQAQKHLHYVHFLFLNVRVDVVLPCVDVASPVSAACTETRTEKMTAAWKESRTSADPRPPAPPNTPTPDGDEQDEQGWKKTD